MIIKFNHFHANLMPETTLVISYGIFAAIYNITEQTKKMVGQCEIIGHCEMVEQCEMIIQCEMVRQCEMFMQCEAVVQREMFG